jgi:integrase
MPKKLTDRFIKSIKPPTTGRAEYWDAKVVGLGLRITEGGHKSWSVLYRHGGRLRRLTLNGGLSLADARKQASKALRAASLGGDPAADKKAERDADTFGELAEDYIKRQAMPNKRSWREDRRALDRDMLPRFKTRKATDIRRRDVIAMLDAIKDRGAPVLANRTLAILRRIFTWAIEKEIVEVNPCLAIKPSPETSRDRVLSEDEIRSLWAAFDEAPLHSGARFKLQLLTATRPGEVKSLRRADLDIEGGWWTIPAGVSKNKLAHRVPLSPKALEIIATLKGEDWLFPSPAGGPVRSNTKPWADIRKTAKVDAKPHDLRRTAASYMAAMGIGRLTLARLLNHVDSAVTAVYDRHSYDREKREALEAWALKIEEILTKTKRDPGKVFAIKSARRG